MVGSRTTSWDERNESLWAWMLDIILLRAVPYLVNKVGTKRSCYGCCHNC